MLSRKRMEDIMSLILNTGTLLATAFVLIGGLLYLIQNGHHLVATEGLQSNAYALTIQQIVQNALSFSSVGIIELGLLTLVATQVLRVALLVWFYLITRDGWFTLFSLFILLTLIYSLFWDRGA